MLFRTYYIYKFKNIRVGKNYLPLSWCLIAFLNIHSTQSQNKYNYYHYLKQATSSE